MLDPYSEPVPFNRLWLRLQVKSTDSPIPHPHILGCIGRQVAPPRWSCQNPVHSRHWLRIPLYTNKKQEWVSVIDSAEDYTVWAGFSLVQRTMSSLLIGAEKCEFASHLCREPWAPFSLVQELRARISLVHRATHLLLIGAEDYELASH